MTIPLGFMWYLESLIQPIILPLCWGSMRHTQRGIPCKHPYLTMSGDPRNVPVLRYWYIVPLTKVLWAAGLKGYLRFHDQHSHHPAHCVPDVPCLCEIALWVVYQFAGALTVSRVMSCICFRLPSIFVGAPMCFSGCESSGFFTLK